MTQRSAFSLATALVVCAALLGPPLLPTDADAATYGLACVSVSSRNGAGNGWSGDHSVSANGRWVAFSSGSSNLVSGDTNRENDVFVRDMRTGVTARVSRGLRGAQANGYSSDPSITADGRYVVFDSDASNLVSGDTNKCSDIFVYDRSLRTTQRVSLGVDGAQANDDSRIARISRYGTHIVFQSYATNLVSGDTNLHEDLFVRDLRAGTTTRVNVSSRRAQSQGVPEWFGSPAISANGRYVAFETDASNLVYGDSNGAIDIFVHDTASHRTTRVSVSSSGVQGDRDSYNASISGSGRYVAYESWSSNLVPNDTNKMGDVFVFDRIAKTTRRVSVSTSGVQSGWGGDAPTISADGRYVVFWAIAANFAPLPGYTGYDIYVRDLVTSQTTRVTRRAYGTEEVQSPPAVSDYANHVVFESQTGLVKADTNTRTDVYICRRAQ